LLLFRLKNAALPNSRLRNCNVSLHPEPLTERKASARLSRNAYDDDINRDRLQRPGVVPFRMNADLKARRIERACESQGLDPSVGDEQD